MNTLVTLNLNGLTDAQAERRDQFYKSLADSKWSKVPGTTVDTAWTISWNGAPTADAADRIIQSHLEAAAKAAAIPTAKVSARWAHDAQKIRAYP